MARRQVECSNCGFLASFVSPLRLAKTLQDAKLYQELGLGGIHEFTQKGRDAIAANRTDIAFSTLYCARAVWSYDSDFKEKPQDVVLQFLNSERNCPYFFTYNPGYSPTEHRELQREAKTQRLLIKGMLLAALIGAAAAIAAQLIAR